MMDYEYWAYNMEATSYEPDYEYDFHLEPETELELGE